MLRNLDTVLKNLDGTPILKERTAEATSMMEPQADEPLTIKDVAINALLASRDGDKLDGTASVARYKLALRLHDGGEQDLKLDDLALIKRLAGLMYMPLVIGQVYAWCDPDPKPAATPTP